MECRVVMVFQLPSMTLTHYILIAYIQKLVLNVQNIYETRELQDTASASISRPSWYMQ